ncbi:MAG TPA: purine-nucleoside phosphorylase [Clostridia bacterium]|mgnify:CR=1 FL=1|nr:purine-nucleoside phosphorylase [Clostridia bacterium]
MKDVYLSAVEYISKNTDKKPAIGLILGSGLGGFADTVKSKDVIPYGEIPGFRVSTAIGHAGELVFGAVKDVDVVIMKGRLHLYEGYHISDIVFPVRIMKLLGVRTLIITNAAGGINTIFAPGDLMLICDHINLSGENPLIGPNDSSFGERFPSMCCAYDPGLRAIAKAEANKLGIKLKEGVYAYTKGPSYETPAEIRMMKIIGADAVGMSTVPEVIAARHAGLSVLGISCITNIAAGLSSQEPNTEEVIEVANSVKSRFTSLIENIISQIGSNGK